MWKKIIALGLVLTLPGAAAAGPLKVSAEKAGRELALAQSVVETRSRSRFWTSLALIVVGGALAALGIAEVGDAETGPDDGEDKDGSDDGEDKDGWGNKAMLGGGVAAAAAGGFMLLTGRSRSGPVVTMRSGRFSVRHTIRF